MKHSRNSTLNGTKKLLLAVLTFIIHFFMMVNTAKTSSSTTKSLSAFNPILRMQQREQGNRTLIILPEGANKTAIKENFLQFQQLFSINLKNVTIDFENGRGKCQYI